MRQHICDEIYTGRNQNRHLLRLPSVLYRTAEVHAARRTCGEVQEQVRTVNTDTTMRRSLLRQRSFFVLQSVRISCDLLETDRPGIWRIWCKGEYSSDFPQINHKNEVQNVEIGRFQANLRESSEVRAKHLKILVRVAEIFRKRGLSTIETNEIGRFQKAP